jgi:hypothetical protein
VNDAWVAIQDRFCNNTKQRRRRGKGTMMRRREREYTRPSRVGGKTHLLLQHCDVLASEVRHFAVFDA